MLRGSKRRGGRMEIERLSDEDWLRCPICLDIFQTPRALACLHTFCEPCLGMYMSDCRASAKDGKLLKVECPVCNHPTIPGDTRKHVQSMVKDFPINHFILPFTDMKLEKYKNGTEKSKKRIQFPQYCGSCSERGVHEEAIVYCNDCGDFQCNECVENHSKMNFLTRHKFVRIEHVNDVSQYVGFYDKRTNCKDHQKEELRFYCEEHDLLLCSICAFENHKACEMATDFGEFGQQLKDKNQHKALRNNLKGLQMTLRDIVEAARTNNYMIMRESEEIPKRIQQTKAKVLRMFEYLEDTANKSIRKYQEKYGKLNSERALKCKQLVCAIESSCAALDTLMLHGTNHQLFSKFQVLKDHLQSFDTLVQIEKEKLECVSIKLKLHDTLESLVSMTEDIGQTYIENISPDVVNVPQLLFITQPPIEEKAHDEKPLQVKSVQFTEKEKHKMKICISTCSIKKVLAMIFEVRNRTWLTYSLVLADSKSLSQVMSMDIKKDPQNAIAFDGSTVAITYPSSGNIEFYLYTPKKKKTPASLSLNKTVKGEIRDAILTKFQTNEFALTTGNFFGIMTDEGTLKQSFYYSISLRTREKDFWSTQLAIVSMCVDTKRKRIYVASTNPHKLYSMTTEGQVMFEYEIGGKVSAMDIDKDGKIYICCHKNGEGKISKVSPSTGKLISDITVALTNPWLICFDRKGKLFYVIENKGGQIKIDKYKFESVVEDEDSEDDL